MWSVSYLDLSNDEVGSKSGFANDKQAIEWMEEQERAGKIIALKLLVWSEYIQCCREVLDFTK